MDWFSGYFLQKRIIAVSDELASILEQDYPSNKLTVINNGIDVKSLSQLDEPDTQPIAPGATFKIGIAGRLVPVKRVDLFIRTARQLQKDFPELNASFHVFGDGPLRKELKSLNQQLDTNNQVIFEGHCEDMHVQLQQLDALLMTSDHEGLPMILLEAMALQTPVIAHAVGGIPDLLDQGDSGILVFEHTASAYARAIHQLFTATEARTAIIKHALHRVSNFYSAEKNARAYLDVYNQLIQKR